MQADQFWTSRKGHVRRGSYYLSPAADQFAGASITQFLQAIWTREMKAIKTLKLPKQIALFCGPKLYRPDTEKKITALAWYRHIVDVLIPKKKTALTTPCLWHNDLDDDNVFVDAHNPKKITGIIDWQCCHISPLFNHNPDPTFLEWNDLEPETLDQAPRPKLSRIPPEERSAALHAYAIQNVLIVWRKLMHTKNPDLYQLVEFRKTAAYELIFLAHRMFGVRVRRGTLPIASGRFEGHVGGLTCLHQRHLVPIRIFRSRCRAYQNR